MNMWDFYIVATKGVIPDADKKIVFDRLREFRRLRCMYLKVGRAWVIKENLSKLWDYSYLKRAMKFFRKWYYWARHSRLAPMIKAAKTINRHLANILTYLKHHNANALSEALNGKIEKVNRKRQLYEM